MSPRRGALPAASTARGSRSPWPGRARGPPRKPPGKSPRHRFVRPQPAVGNGLCLSREGVGGERGGLALPLPSQVCAPTHARVGAGAPAPPSEPSVERSRCARPCVHIALCVARGLYSRYWEPEAGGLRGKGPRKMQTNAMHLYTITGYNR